MKKFYFLFLSFLFISTFSQNPLLLGKGWMIDKVIIDNVTYEPTNPDGIEYFLYFYETSSFSYISRVCSEHFGNINYNPNANEFLLTTTQKTENLCAEFSQIAAFDDAYFLFFSQNQIPAIPNLITYEIIQNPNSYQLILTNASGNKAYFNFYEPTPNLTAESWTLSSMKIGGVTYNVPSHFPGYETTITANGFFNTIYCNSLQGNVGFYPDQKFRLLEKGITLGWCFPPMTDSDMSFDTKYWEFYTMDNSNYYPYTYEISANNQTLTFTKQNGDYVIFNNKFLGTTEANNQKTKVYPNPISDKLTISGTENIGNYSILDASGKILLQNALISTKNLEVDFQKFPVGVYYIKLNDKEIHKIIKK